MPGYGFSGKPRGTGWDPDRIARAWDELMKRLGYTHYVSQGGDWGSVIVGCDGEQAPPGLLGIHVNMPATVPPEIAKALTAGEPAPAGLSGRGEGRIRLGSIPSTRRAAAMRAHDGHPSADRGLRELADSPAGLAAWMYDKFAQWTYSGGEPERSLTQGRDARRHHALLGHEQRDLFRAALLGEQRQQLQRGRKDINRSPSR